jgi:hypothetical protein
VIASFKKFGRLGNRLFLAAHLVAFSRYGKVPVALKFFSQYRDTFPYFKNDPTCMFPAEQRHVQRNLSLLSMRTAGYAHLVPTVRFWDERDVVFDGKDCADPRVQRMLSSRCVIFEGWRFRSLATIRGIMPEIRRVFAPDNRAIETAQRSITRARESCDLTVGVHIRWEDYRGTPQFFDLPEYLESMKEIENILSPAKVGFVVCSPEKLTAESFPRNSLICEGRRSVDDLYTLAECNYLIGPASTFSGWASFFGGIPLFMMRKGEHFRDSSDSIVLQG